MCQICSNFAPVVTKIRHIVWLILMAVIPCAVHAEHHDLHAEADRPGFGTGTNVLPFGTIQWETGFECLHLWNMHAVTLPTSLFRFGLGPWAELRLEYTGLLLANDHPDDDPTFNDVLLYEPSPLNIGSKVRLWEGSEEPKLKWIPRTSLLLNIGLPITRTLADYMPFSGGLDVLFENDLADWLMIGYDFGVYWVDWAPTPDLFASLAFNFIPTDKLGVFVESYNAFDPDALDIQTGKTYTHCHIGLDFGLTYMVHPHVQLDTYAGFYIYNSDPTLATPRDYVYVGLGVTWLLYTGKKANKQL